MASPRIGVAALGVVAAVALAGCGSGETVLDMAKVKHDIATAMAARNHIRTPVTCPKGRVAPVEKGERFVCRVHLAVGEIAVTVTQTDDKGNVNVKWAPFLMLPTPRLERLIVSTIADNTGLHAVPHCPGPVLEREQLNFTCTRW